MGKKNPRTRSNKIKFHSLPCPCSTRASSSEEQQQPCLVYRSPIALGNDIGTIFCSSSIASSPSPSQVVEYKYNEEKNQWDVLSNVRLLQNGQEYKLDQFHLHQPGEHPIQGKAGVLEWHLVFGAEDPTTDPPTMLVAVSAFQARLSKSHTSRGFRQLLRNEPISIPDLGNYWSYAGSLTEPPFILNVAWNIANHFLSITKADLRALQSRSKSAEEVQRRDGRDVVFAVVASKEKH